MKYDFKKFFILNVLTAILLVAGTPAFAQIDQTSVESETIIQRTNDFYNKGNYLKAVESINCAIELYEHQKNFPENIQLMAEASYYAWINSIYKDSIQNEGRLNKADFEKAVLYLKLHPQAASTRITSIINRLFDSQHSKLEQLRRNNLDESKKKQWRKLNNKILELENSQKELEYVIAGHTSVDMIKKKLQTASVAKKEQKYRILTLIFCILIFAGIAALITIVILNHKKKTEAQHNFETTLEVVAMLHQNSIEDSEKLDQKTQKSVPRLSNDFFAKSDIAFEDKIQEFFGLPDSSRRFMELETKCFSLGSKIDTVTLRRNNSRKVGELIFKICNLAGLPHNTSMIYYCAGMVYDAGFLSISKDILTAQHLTIKQRYEVRSHVQIAAKYLDFVPEELKPIFIMAAESHHENMDGKGYLSGLHSAKIPLIARMIRVCESYVSLVNYRVYHQIMDKDSAIQELKRKSGVYDNKIIDLLERVI